MQIYVQYVVNQIHQFEPLIPRMMNLPPILKSLNNVELKFIDLDYENYRYETEVELEDYLIDNMDRLEKLRCGDIEYYRQGLITPEYCKYEYDVFDR